MAKTTCGRDNFMGCAYDQPCPEHVQRDWAGQKLVRELQEAVRGHSYATTQSPQQEWDELLAEVRSARRNIPASALDRLVRMYEDEIRRWLEGVRHDEELEASVRYFEHLLGSGDEIKSLAGGKD